MFDAVEIARRIRAVGLAPLLPEMCMLDRLLRSRCPEIRETLLRDGYLFPIHRRLTDLSRCIAFVVDRDGLTSEELGRWLYLNVAELAEANPTGAASKPDETGE